MRPTLPILAAGIVALATAPALADEAWETNLGFVVWEDTLGPDAVLRLYSGGETDGPVIRMVVPGLGTDTTGGRGAYRGVWVASDSDVACPTEMLDPLGGGKTRFWGSFVLTFVGPTFPSDWAGVYGNCLEQPMTPIQARALVGDERNRAP